MTVLHRPSRHDGVTMACPVCGDTFLRVGRRRFCSDACRAAAWRRRHGVSASLAVPAAVALAPVTVYACDWCGERSVGVQRCEACARFMHRLGIGGACPGCDEPVTVKELIGREVTLMRR